MKANWKLKKSFFKKKYKLQMCREKSWQWESSDLLFLMLKKKKKVLPVFAWLHVTTKSNNTQLRMNMFGCEESLQTPSAQQALWSEDIKLKKQELTEGNFSRVIIYFPVERYCVFREELQQGRVYLNCNVRLLNSLTSSQSQSITVQPKYWQ